MLNFTWDGVEVRTSTLTQRAFRAVCCELLVRVTPDNQRQALEAFAQAPNKYSGLSISGISDLTFLADFPNLRYLQIDNAARFNPRPLDGLSNLRGLQLETPGGGLDFSCFPHLEVFVGDWHNDNSNVHRCDELRQLRAWQYKPKSLDLRGLANTTRLEWLSLTQTNITSCAGLELLPDLRYCDLAYAPKLESLDAFKTDGLQLRELSLSKAKSVKSYEPIASLHWLRRLRLSDCSPMPNLRWTQGLNELDNFSFVETNVEDGNLSPLLELPKLRYVGTMDKKHYSHKFAALNALLEERWLSHRKTDNSKS